MLERNLVIHHTSSEGEKLHRFGIFFVIKMFMKFIIIKREEEYFSYEALECSTDKAKSFY